MHLFSASSGSYLSDELGPRPCMQHSAKTVAFGVRRVPSGWVIVRVVWVPRKGEMSATELPRVYPTEAEAERAARDMRP